ncbi:hypothetical protein OUZ56_004403 [Daphnia magna]|uniref:Uncharacterized protein n=1 Tax=Daphnia magna TaxID=35525 RepID=A0ABQ9YPU8_9CRUS|nr:hypothetical protein OUZ56_004403 [Daphnia magna]
MAAISFPVDMSLILLWARPDGMTARRGYWSAASRGVVESHRAVSDKAYPSMMAAASDRTGKQQQRHLHLYDPASLLLLLLTVTHKLLSILPQLQLLRIGLKRGSSVFRKSFGLTYGRSFQRIGQIKSNKRGKRGTDVHEKFRSFS